MRQPVSDRSMRNVESLALELVAELSKFNEVSRLLWRVALRRAASILEQADRGEAALGGRPSAAQRLNLNPDDGPREPVRHRVSPEAREHA